MSAVYVAIEDENGIILIQRVSPGDNGAKHAEDYPDYIYFEVPPRPLLEDVKAALRKNDDKVVNMVALALIALGSKSEWTMEDNFAVTESVAMLAKRCGLPDAANQSDEELAYWRALADDLGIDHDGEY